tara:strand:- start:5029 stop:5985 length:957 start_codon:yes stop_codon:yes gene_type:complete
MIKYCLIKPNQFDNSNLPIVNEKHKNDIPDTQHNIYDFDKKLNYADINKFKEDTNNFLEIKETSTEDYLLNIQDDLNSNEKYMIVTEDLYQNREYLYQMIFADIYHEETDIKNVNLFATYFTNEYKAIVGNVIIMKIKVPINTAEALCESINYNDIYFLLKSEKFHAGVIIHDDERMTQIYYDNNYNLINMDKNNTLNTNNNNIFKDTKYNGYQDSLLKFDLNIYVRKPDTYERGDVKINAIASKIFNMKVEGDSLFVCKDMEFSNHYDLFIEDIADLLKVSADKRKLTKDEKNENEVDQENKKIFKSRYRILHNRIK